MKNKNGFTLIELLAVIAILAILVILALPNVINRFNEAKKQTFLTEAKKIYTESEKKFLSSSISGSPVKVINSEDNSKLDMTGKKLQYCVILNNSGKVKDIKVSNRQWIASLVDGKEFEDLTIDDLVEGNLDDYNCSNSGGHQSNTPEPLNCTFDGELIQGAEYVNGQYTYRYMQEQDDLTDKFTIKPLEWVNISTDGWGVKLTDKDSTDAVTSVLCTTINNKPVVSMSYAFSKSNASSIDLSNSNTSNVTNMEFTFSGTKGNNLNISNLNTSKVTNMLAMFLGSSLASIDLSGFDTSKVTNMQAMFMGTNATTIDVSNLNTSRVTNMSEMFNGSKATIITGLNKFKTTNVTDMGAMFSGTNVTTLDLSAFDTSKVTSMSGMFFASNLTTITGLDKFNTSNVTNMTNMFRGTKLKIIDLSSFDTSKVTGMGAMFVGNDNLTTIYVSNKFVTSSLNEEERKNYVFYNSTKLVGGAGTVYDSNNVDASYARIDGGTSNPGYFTLKQ